MTVFAVENTNDSGPGSLRYAITRANESPGTNKIGFNICDNSRTIKLLSELPEIQSPVLIDATSQPGFIGKPLIELDGSLVGPCTAGLKIVAGSCEIRGLSIISFTGHGVALSDVGDNQISGNYIGVDVDGKPGCGNSMSGVYVAVSDNLIGGPLPEDVNVISGNAVTGIHIVGCGRNTIQGNLIGTDTTGKTSVGNTSAGIGIGEGADNLIGGNTPGARNIISGNGGYGILIAGKDAFRNKVIGNFIGTDVSGSSEVANSRTGVLIFNAPSNTIGGLDKTEGNVISGNARHGINIDGSAPRGKSTGASNKPVAGGQGNARNNVVVGNLIGTDVSGTKGLGNGVHGVIIFMGQKNTIGGDVPGSRNVISGNKHNGILIAGSNPEGPDWRKTIRKPSDNEIEETVRLEDRASEIEVKENVIAGNFVGVDITGKNALGNGRSGVAISHASSNLIGGVAPEAQNIISGNNLHGVQIIGSTSTLNSVFGNIIGAELGGENACGNFRDGVNVRNARWAQQVDATL